ncbi:hypothetical protein L6452_19732 [Arctium lappa]|uniref:Uncharacterized protein n=1 Tax=Arctium lappa TaxID=4217 RepID=A0ACB9B8W1_ARCLA|nr:hypothetical protein L6452_19732 [Arctium lappa]
MLRSNQTLVFCLRVGTVSGERVRQGYQWMDQWTLRGRRPLGEEAEVVKGDEGEHPEGLPHKGMNPKVEIGDKSRRVVAVGQGVWRPCGAGIISAGEFGYYEGKRAI